MLLNFLHIEKKFPAAYILFVGTCVSQAIAIGGVPFLARIYSPSDYGILAVFISVSNIIGVVSCARYDIAILLPKGLTEMVSVIRLAFRVLTWVALSTLAICASLYFANKVDFFGKTVIISSWLWFVPMSVFALGLQSIISQFSNRAQWYESIAKAQISQSFFSFFTCALLGICLLHYVGAMGLIIGTLVGQVVNIFVNVKGRLKRLFRILYAKPYSPATANKYIDMPCYSMPEALLSAFLQQIPVLSFSWIFGSSVVGYYAMAQRLVLLPVVLVGGVLSKLLFREYAVTYNSGRPINGLLLDTWVKYASLALIPALLLFFTSGWLFKAFLGASWAEAGKMVEIICVLGYFSFLAALSSPSHVVLRMQHVSLLFSATTLVVKCLIILVGKHSSVSVYTMLWCFVLWDITTILAMNALAYRKACKSYG
jgi:O-antigen/teichoic acid export membrane protein